MTIIQVPPNSPGFMSIFTFNLSEQLLKWWKNTKITKKHEKALKIMILPPEMLKTLIQAINLDESSPGNLLCWFSVEKVLSWGWIFLSNHGPFFSKNHSNTYLNLKKIVKNRVFEVFFGAFLELYDTPWFFDFFLKIKYPLKPFLKYPIP